MRILSGHEKNGRPLGTYINAFSTRTETDTAAALRATNTQTAVDKAAIRWLLVSCSLNVRRPNLREVLIEICLTATEMEVRVKGSDGG
jgi:hypothetical protein